MPLVNRTRAILRSAELGFLGVMVRTWVHTPRFWGLPFALPCRRPLERIRAVAQRRRLFLFRLGLAPFPHQLIDRRQRHSSLFVRCISQ